MSTSQVSHSVLPGQNPLSLDYLHNFERVADLYPGGALSHELLEARANCLVTCRTFPRNAVSEVLGRFNREVGASQQTLANVELLKDPESVAVVTGQQLGLFGGPAFSFYKAATVIRVAQSLREQGVKAVPVFWLPSDDSDYEEVRATNWVDQEGELLRVSYPVDLGKAERMVGTVPLNEISRCQASLRSAGIGGEFGDQVLDDLEREYGPERNFRTAFASWLADLFPEHGLVLFDSLAEGYRPLVKEVFRTAIEKRSDIVDALSRQRALLESRGYEAQVWTDETETLLFWLEGETRSKIRYRDGRFQVRTSSANLSLTTDEMLARLEENPEKISSNVLLRPIVQEHLFPTVAYVAGAAEIAYHAQISAISGFWNVSPLVMPRAAFTLVDRKSQRILRQYGLQALDVIRKKRLDLSRSLLRENHAGQIIEGFERLQKDVERQVEGLQAMLEKEDRQSVDMLRLGSRKVLYQIGRVHDRFVRNQEQKNANLTRHLDYLYGQLLPGSKLQERVVNFNQFLAVDRETLPDRLISSIDPLRFTHQVFEI